MFRSLSVMFAMVMISCAVVIAADPIGYYPLQEIIAGETPDISGNGNDGQVVEATVISDGVIGNAFNFTGGYYSGADVVSINDDLYDDMTTMSISLWVRLSTLDQQYTRIVQKGASDSPGGYVIYMDDISGHIKLEVYKWDGSYPGRWKTTDAISANVWHHIVVVYDMGSTANDAVFYIDGQLANSYRATSPSGTSRSDAGMPFVIAGRSNTAGTTTDRGYIGDIDEVSVYNTLLTAADVQQLYLTGAGTWISNNGSDIYYTNGNVGIGVIADPSARLHVLGNVLVNGEITVDSDGADFVFSPDYPLRSLSQVETHINENRHLPDIPSAAEMQGKGMGVSEMQTKLLQKVEELTLYLIEQHKRLDLLEKENAALKGTLQGLMDQPQGSRR